jgi:hypothetical protein
MKIGQVRAELFYTDRRRDRPKLRISLFAIFLTRLTRRIYFCMLNLLQVYCLQRLSVQNGFQHCVSPLELCSIICEVYVIYSLMRLLVLRMVCMYPLSIPATIEQHGLDYFT